MQPRPRGAYGGWEAQTSWSSVFCPPRHSVGGWARLGGHSEGELPTQNATPPPCISTLTWGLVRPWRGPHPQGGARMPLPCSQSLNAMWDHSRLLQLIYVFKILHN